jgi:hypothetical protein
MTDTGSDTGSSSVDFLGPFESHIVVVNGREVPHLQATPLPGGRVFLSLARQVAVELSLQEAERLVPFIADAIAVGMGYTCHPSADMDGPVRAHPFPTVFNVLTADI